MSQCQGLRNALISLLNEKHPRAGAQRFLDICYRQALAYLQVKKQANRLPKSELSVEDLAFDCVAELFARDDRGRFCTLHSYFSELSLEAMDDEELLESTRRLVFSVVNDNLFRHYREMDPVLSKLIRNLKLATREIPGASLTRKHGQVWIECGSSETGLPVMPPEFLEIHMAPHIKEEINAVRFLRAAVDLLQNQTLYRKAIPLIELAQVVRLVLVRAHEAEAQEESTYYPQEDLEHLIQDSIESVRKGLQARYVEKRKLDAPTFEAYLRAIHEQLRSRYVDDNGHDLTHYQALSMHLTGLSREEYRRVHRAVFEYLSRSTRDQLAARLRHE